MKVMHIIYITNQTNETNQQHGMITKTRVCIHAPK